MAPIARLISVAALTAFVAAASFYASLARREQHAELAKRHIDNVTARDASIDAPVRLKKRCPNKNKASVSTAVQGVASKLNLCVFRRPRRPPQRLAIRVRARIQVTHLRRRIPPPLRIIPHPLHITLRQPHRIPLPRIILRPQRHHQNPHLPLTLPPSPLRRPRRRRKLLNPNRPHPRRLRPAPSSAPYPRPPLRAG